MTHSNDATPWMSWLRIAIGMGVTPAAFWKLSLKEWRALMQSTRPGAFNRHDLEKLRHHLGDKTKHERD